MKNIKEYNNLENYINKIGEFLSQNNRYTQLLYTSREIVQQEITVVGLTREKTIVEFANIEQTVPSNSEDRTSLFPEVKDSVLVCRSNISKTYFNLRAYKGKIYRQLHFYQQSVQKCILIFEMSSFNK